MLSELASRLWTPARTAQPPAAGWRACGPENHGDTSQQAPGRLPHWPADWHRRWPLDPLVFGAVPRVAS